MKVFLHLCLTAGSCINSAPVASTHVREQQELLHEGDELAAEGGPRAGSVLSSGTQQPNRARVVRDTASLCGPRKGDRRARSQPGRPGKNKRRQA